jgi:16S rRNA (guanine527-N7)-methyltransferase
VISLGLDEGVRSILGRNPGQTTLDALHKYLEMLLKWQRSARLVGSSDPAWIVENIVLDSLLFTKVLPIDAQRVLDLGAGAGVPGIPLAIALPYLEMTLVESRQKRASFLAQAIRELALGKARVVRERLTQASTPVAMIGAFDAVVMRCAGDVSTVVPVALPLVRQGGVVVASGPPKAYALSTGHWVTVPGVRHGSTRRFAVVSH